MSTKLDAINIVVLVAAIVLTGCSIATFYLTVHASTTMASYFPAGDYVWFGARAPEYSTDYYAVGLAYDWSNENYAFAGAGLSIFTGVLGMIAYCTTRKTPSKFWSFSTLFFSFIGFAVSLLAFLRITLVNASYVNQKSCDPSGTHGPNAVFTCTRELASCNLLDTLIEHDFEQRNMACQQSRAGRWALVPLAGAGFLLFLLTAVKMCVQRKVVLNNRKSADLRVRELQSMAQI